MRLTPMRTVAALLLAFAFACGDDGTGPDNGDPSGPMTALIDGASFVASFATVNRGGGQVYVNGAASPPRAIGFTIPDEGPGTYTIAVGKLVAAGVTIGNDAWVAGGDQGSGSVTLTTFTESRLVGTFTFSLLSSGGQAPLALSVTNGQFDITY